jgi:hypothetical protein
VNVGIPDVNGHNGGARDENYMTGAAASGNPSACSSTFCSPVWRRDYTNAIMLTRPLSYNSPGSEVSTYSVTIPLSGTYYPLNADGTSGSAITSIQLRGGESAILLKAPTTASVAASSVSSTDSAQPQIFDFEKNIRLFWSKIIPNASR